jgi:anaerobic ribonucleoside-triphosphate reductase activating protein
MEPENQERLLPFLLEFKSRFPNKTIWLYTGNTLEELLGNHRNHTAQTEKILSLVAVLVDGRYDEKRHSLGLRFRGSENQRVIDMNRTRAEGKIILLGIEDRTYENQN